MAIILNKRPKWLEELGGATSSLAGALKLRADLDAQKEDTERRKRDEKRQEKLDRLHEELARSQESRAGRAEERAQAAEGRAASLFPMQQRAAEVGLQGAELGLNRESLEAEGEAATFEHQQKMRSREDEQYQAGVDFWKTVAETTPGDLPSKLTPLIGKLPRDIQGDAWEMVRDQKRSQILQQRFTSASGAIERAMKDGVFSDSVDEKGESVTSPESAQGVAEMAKGLAEWRDLIATGDPVAEQIARNHQFSPDNVERDLMLKRAKRAKQRADQVSNQQLLAQLEEKYAAASALLEPGSPELFAIRLAIDSFAGKDKSGDEEDRDLAVKAVADAVSGGRRGRAVGDSLDLGGVKIQRDPNVPLEGVDWNESNDAQRARLESYALERMQKRQGSVFTEPDEATLTKETHRLARELGWTNLPAGGAKGQRAFEDLTGRERKAMEADAADGMTAEEIATKYRIDPGEAIQTGPGKLQPIGKVPKAKRFQVGKLMLRAQREELTGQELVQQLTALGIDPQSFYAMSEEEHSKLLKDSGYDESSVLDPEKPKPKKKPPVYPGNNKGR